MTELKTQKPREERKRTKKVFASLAAVTMVGVAGVAGTTAALSDTTENPANEFDAAFIELTDNDGGSFMYDVFNQEPGDFVERCIQISYVGTSPTGADLALYVNGATGAGAGNLNLTVESGTQASNVGFRPAIENEADDPNDTCNSFVPTGAALFDDTLAAFQAAHSSDANALADPTPLATGVPVVYRITVELDPLAVVTSANNLSGTHTYTWYAEQA